MASLSSVQAGDPINSSNVNQFQEALSGQGNYPISLTGVNDGSLYALDVRNQDATNQRSFRVRNSSGENQIVADGSGVTLNQVAISSGTIAGSTITAATISGSTITGATITGSTFSGTSTGSTFSGGLIRTSTLSLLAASSNVVQVPQVKVTHNATQSISSGSATALTFNTETYDNDGLHSTASNPTRLTPSRAGLWHIGGHVTWKANSSGYRDIAIRLNGTAHIARQRTPTVSSAMHQTVVTETQLSTTDYAELVVEQDGGSIGIVSSANLSPLFWMSYRGAT